MSEINPHGKPPRDVVADLAADDADFRAQLVEDPKTAIRDTLGLELGDDVEVSVLQESEGQLYVVLPHVDPALEESELAGVVGGIARAMPKISPTRIRPITVTQWTGCLTCT